MNLIFFSFRKVVFLFCFTICCTQLFAQAVDDYRTRQSGDWNDVNTWERWNGSSWQIPNASAFPVVSATATSTKSATAGTTHIVSLPAGIQSGDLLLIFWADADDVNTDPGTPLGWTQLYTTTTNNRIFRAWYKIASGLEGTTLSITAGTERSAHTSYRIASGSYQGVPVAGTAVTGTSNTPNPPNLTSGFGATNTLWIAATHSGGDDNSPAPTAPTNYTGIITIRTGNSNTTHARVATATRELSAASENPGTFGLGSSVDWLANTVAIRSVPVTGTPTNLNGVITIRNGHTVTVTASVSADQCTIDVGGQVTVNASQTLTVANGTGTDLIVNGTVVNSGTITTTGTVAFNAASIYQHAQNGGTIPTATWNATSNCNITGVTNTVPTVASFDQSFGNFTWDCVGQSNTLSLVGNLKTVNGNLTIGNTNQSSGRVLAFASTSSSTYTLNIGGDLIVTENAWLSITNGDNITATVNVAGNFNMSGTASNTTYFDFHIATGGSTTLAKIILNVAGNFTQSGGYFDFASGGSNATNFTELRLGGDLSLTGTGIFGTTTNDVDITNGTTTFNKAGTQTIFAATPANMTYVNFIIDINSTLQLLSNIELSSIGTVGWGGKFTVNSGGILNASTNQILSSTGAGAGTNNVFTLNSGAGLLTANVNGVQNANIGTVSTSLATRTFSSGGNYTYNNSTTAQNSGTFTTTPTANQVNNLTINNTAGNTTTGVTLQQPIAVAGTLTLTSGHITTTSNLLTMNAGSNVASSNYAARTPGGSDNSFINGPMKKIGNTNFLFPVGKINGGEHYCGISSPASVTDSYTAEYKRSSGTALGTITALGLDHVSNCEYWDISTTVGSPNTNVTLSWNGNSNCSAGAYVDDPASLVAAHFNGTSWNKYGGTVDAVGMFPSYGSVTWAGVTTFSPFTLGSTNPAKNPLPVKLINVKAYRNGDKNKIEWTNVTESDVAAYEVQKSVNGTNFDMITSLSARSNASDKQDYSAYDYQVDPVAYYRIKVLSADGSTTYSAIVKVAADVKVTTELVLYPNPVTGKQFTIQLNSAPTDYSLRVYAANGQLVTTENFKHPGGNFSKTVELPAQLPAGQYYLQLSGGEQVLSTKFVVQ